MVFPNGITHYLIGGLILGLGIALIYILTGIQAGASGFLSAALAKLTKQKKYLASLHWRTIFTIATIAGAFVYALLFDDFFVTGVSTWRLLAGGILVGYGARAARGCTSGHGLCGLGASTKRSLVFVLIILAFAFLTGWLV